MDHMTAELPRARVAAPTEAPDRDVRVIEHGDFGVLVGWSHTQFNRGIDLRVQSAAQATDAQGQIDSRHLLMTNNQALILAKYLLDVTGQELPERKRPGLLKRLFGNS